MEKRASSARRPAGRQEFGGVSPGRSLRKGVCPVSGAKGIGRRRVAGVGKGRGLAGGSQKLAEGVWWSLRVGFEQGVGSGGRKGAVPRGAGPVETLGAGSGQVEGAGLAR